MSDASAAYGESRDAYLKAVGERLPKDILIYWTGPKVKSNVEKPEYLDWFTNKAEPTRVVEGMAGPILLRDMNGDGLADMIACAPDLRALFVFYQRKGHALLPDPNRPDDRLAMPRRLIASRIAAGDLDGDGKPDLVAASNSLRAVVAFTKLPTPPASDAK